MSKIVKKMKIMQPGGTLSDYVPIGAEAENINVDGESVETKLGKKPYYYDTVADMKADLKLKAGDMAVTLGYYEPNDGGAAEYRIVSGTHTDDGGSYHELSNSLFAELIIKNNTINIKQLGAKSQDSQNSRYDIASYIQKYLDIMTLKGYLIKLYIPGGCYFCSPILLKGRHSFYIYGDESFSHFSKYCKGTIISSLNDNQEYIFSIGNTSNVCAGWTLKNIIFTSSNYLYSIENNYFTFATTPKTIGTCLKLHYAEYGITDNLFFLFIKGQALSINASWEIYFKLLNFRNVSNYENGGIVNFETADTNLSEGANITACCFEKMMFENVHGHLMNFENKCSVINNHFGIINCEPNKYIINNEVYTTFTNESAEAFDDTAATHFAMFNLEDASNWTSFNSNVIDSIELNNYSYFYWVYNNNTYLYDTIIKYGNKTGNPNIYNNITLSGGIKKTKIIYLPNTVTALEHGVTGPTFNNIVTDTKNGFIFDINGLSYLTLSDTFKIDGVETDGAYGAKSSDIYIRGGWIPCYKSQSLKQYKGTGLGALYYDEDSFNGPKIIVKPRTEDNNLDRGIFSTVVGPNKHLYLRAKVPDGETVRIYINNITAGTSVNLNCVGTGNYEFYDADLSTFNLGDKLYLTMSSNSSYQRNICADVYICN